MLFRSVGINDDDINNLGEWPWTRDILADVLIRLKELDVAAGIFDIEYISPPENRWLQTPLVT